MSTQPAADLYRIAFTDLRCLETTDDQGSAHDEPYALFFVVDLQGDLPQLNLFRTRVFQGVDEDAPENNPKQHVRFWGTNGQAAAITHPDKVIVLVALMENDDSDIGHIMAFSLAVLTMTVTAIALNHDSHATRVAKLKTAFRSAIDLGAITTKVFDSDDDRIGDIEELVIHRSDLERAKKTGTLVHKSLVFAYPDADKDGERDDQGKYRLDFEIAAGA